MSIFKLPTNLKRKSIKPAGRAQSPKTKPANAQPAVLTNNPEDLERLAMEAMSDLAAKFPAWASGDVQKMKQHLGEAYGVFKQERTDVIRQKVYPKAHDLKGQGTTKDVSEASKWFKLSEEQGYEKAKKQLDNLQSRLECSIQ